MTDLTAILPAGAFQTKRTDEFAPKLGFEERCAILALLRAGVRRPILAAAFGIDKRTIGHIGNNASQHYRNVRQEYEKLGAVDFKEKYLTEAILAKLKAAADEFKPPEPRLNPKINPAQASPRARGKSGIQTVKPDQCRFSHRLDIQWKEPPDTPTTGWHFRDLDSDSPDAWYHNGVESLKTSQACFAEAVANLTDD
jgi:hypothetical protein